ncbi:MAG: RNA polymerase sigma factor [Bacillota bacterium]|nr:RNA polymerase sigma factor [Bacillota bacterium]
MISIDFNQLYNQYFKRLLFIAYSFTKDRSLAEDVVQETFIKAYRKMEAVEDFDKIGSWLSSIAARTAIDFLRAEKRRKWITAEQSFIENIHDQTPTNFNTEDKVIYQFLKEEINHSLMKLSQEYQIVLILKIQHGLKENEIARLLRLKTCTVKTRIYRARKQLKQLFTVSNFA